MIHYCTQCGAETVRTVPEHDTEVRSVCKECHQVFYDSPTCLIGCALLCGNKMLWTKRGLPPRKGYWSHGATGHIESRESLQQATVRAVFEKVGIRLDARQLELVGVGSLTHMNRIYTGFFIELETESGTASRQVEEVAWFTEDAAPWDKLAFPETEPFIRALYSWINQGRQTNGLSSLPVILKEAIFDRITSA